jgi:hypothetical protein
VAARTLISRHAKCGKRGQGLANEPFNATPHQKCSDFIVAALALALPSPSGFAYFGALALSPSALCLLGCGARIVAPALIPHASEEQDLSCAAVARSPAMGTVRGREKDDIVHCGPR